MDRAGGAAAGDEGEGPFHQRRHVGDDGGSDDGAGDDGGGGGDAVEEVIEPGDVVSRDFEEGGGEEADEGGPGGDPVEAVRQIDVPRVGREAHDQERDEDAEAAGGGEADSEGDGEGEFHGGLFGHLGRTLDDVAKFRAFVSRQ